MPVAPEFFLKVRAANADNYMKTNRTILIALLTLLAWAGQAWAQGTAFTYQGRLNDGAGPANGTYDIR